MLVAAVGGLATAGVIIVRNAVGGAGDQVDETGRQERLAQLAVNESLRIKDDGNRENGTPPIEDARIHYDEVRDRCRFDRYYTKDGERIYPLRQWRGAFVLKFVQETVSTARTPANSGGTGDGKNGAAAAHWCDAVPVNNLVNNPANFAEPIRRNTVDSVCVRWPDHNNWRPNTNEKTGVESNTNEACSWS